MTDDSDPIDFDALEYGEHPTNPRPAKRRRAADRGQGDAWPDYLLDGYHARFDWQREPASEKQIAALSKRGYNPPPGLTKGECSHCLDQPTMKQIAALRRWRRYKPGMTFAQAREALSELFGKGR